MDMETLTWFAIMSSCGTLVLVIIFNGILLCLLEHGHATTEIALCEEKFAASLKVAKFAAASSFSFLFLGIERKLR